MGLQKKTKIRVINLLVTVTLFLMIILFILFQKVRIIYFTNPKCRITKKTDVIMNKIGDEFGDKVLIKKVIVNIYPGDPSDPEDVKRLRERYKVYGVPEIVINGKKFIGNYTEESIKESICKNFLVKPGPCR